MALAPKVPRALAAQILKESPERFSQSLALALKKSSAFEKQWLQEVTSGVMRFQGRLDLILRSYAKKPPKGETRILLWIALYQIIAQDQVHPGIVVSETVELLKKKKGLSVAKFANALLRKAVGDQERWGDLDLEGALAHEKDLASWLSLPDWIWKRVKKDRGKEEAIHWALANLKRPRFWKRMKQTTTPEELFEREAFHEKEDFQEGQFFIQDLSSQTLIQENVQILRKHMGEKLEVLDLCAAPGGKSVGLAWSGVKVTATDFKENRLGKLKENIQRLAPKEVSLLPYSKVFEESWPWIWVDAPCSGTGVLRKHPEIRWNKGEKELENLKKIQRELLQKAWEKILPGGFLTYTVCSVLKEEGIEQIHALKLNPHLVHEWFLAPHLSPFGDGFQGFLLRKPH